MYAFFKRCAAVFAIILVAQNCSSAYAEEPRKEAQSAVLQSKKTAYITLDDGPSRSITPTNLDTLKRYGVKATFFVLPRSGADDLYKRIVEEGHAIGNHSYSHDYNYLYGSTENFKKDIIKAGNFIFSKTGYTPTVFRFPGGTIGRSKAVVKERAGILADLGYEYFDWDVSTADTDPNLKTYGSEEHIVSLLANNILNNTRDRKTLIILMHDTSKYSAKALPRIIEGLQKQGYAFDVLTNDWDWQYELNGSGEAVITGYTGDNRVVAVPSMLDGRRVTSISGDVFADDAVTGISIPDSVVNIDGGAFWECTTLTAINVSEGNPNYKSVDGVAFSKDGTVLVHYPAGKTRPSDAYIVPGGVTAIGRCAFDHNQTLQKIVIPSGVTRIGDAAFWRCTALESFEIPSSVTDMGSGVFANCGGLSEIAVESGNPAFKSVDGVVLDGTGALLKQYPPGRSGSYTVPAGVCTIGEGAFRGSNGLTQVILGDSVSRIDGTAFAFCESLTDVQLGNGLTSIGGMVFQCCVSLRSVIMPQSLTAVEDLAFEGCKYLTDAYFLGDMPDFGNNVFQNTSKEFSVDYLEDHKDSWADYSAYPKKPFSDIPYFNDVASGAWYKNAVNDIAARGITAGTGNGNFCPDAKLKRGQLITLLMRACGVEPDSNPTDNFTDAGSTYYTGYLAAAKRLGISDGLGDNLFAPEKEISRQEMFTLLYKVLEVAERLPQIDSNNKTLSDFSDWEQVDSWAIDAAALLIEAGIIDGSNGKLDPHGTTSRAEMAQALYKLMSKYDVESPSEAVE